MNVLISMIVDGKKSFPNVYICQIITLYTLSILQFYFFSLLLHKIMLMQQKMFTLLLLQQNLCFIVLFVVRQAFKTVFSLINQCLWP